MSQLYQLFTVGICIFLTEYKDTIGFDYFILKPKKKKSTVILFATQI